MENNIYTFTWKHSFYFQSLQTIWHMILLENVKLFKRIFFFLDNHDVVYVIFMIEKSS